MGISLNFFYVKFELKDGLGMNFMGLVVRLAAKLAVAYFSGLPMHVWSTDGRIR